MSEPHVVNEDRWASIPEPLLYDPTICAEAVRVYGVLRRHGEDPNNCHPSHRRIAEFIGKSARSIPAWIRDLETAGWVERVPRKTANGDPDTNGYRVFGRAQQRGVRASQRGGSTAASAEGTTPESAPKESKVEREQVNEKLPAATPRSATDDPVKACAHRMAVLAMDQPTKPVLRDGGNPFVAVMGLFERLLRGGMSVNALTEAIEGEFVTVWTIAGIQTAVAQARGRPKQNAGERRMAKAAAAVGLDPAGVKADSDAFIATMFDHGKSGDRPLNSDRVIDTTAKGDQ